MLSFLFMISIILFYFRGVSDVPEMFVKCSKVLLYLSLMSKMSDVFLYAVPMMIYCEINV